MKSISLDSLRRSINMTHLHSEISVQQHLELKTLVAFVPYIHHRLQSLSGQSNAVDQTEIVRPSLLEVLGQRRRVQSKVQLDTIVRGSSLGGHRLRFRSRLAQELPAHCAAKTMLSQGRSGMILRRRPKHLDGRQSLRPHRNWPTLR